MTELSNADGTKSAAGGARNSRACRGRLDLVRHDLIEGWAQDEIHPRAPLRLNVIADGRILFEVLADQFREDLRAGGIGEGRHAFSVPVNPALSRTDRHRIEVRRADDGRPLPGSPQELPAQEAPTHVESEQELPEQPSPWHGNLDAVGRERLEGWAWDERAPGIPVALIVLDNGIPIARAIANAYRRDLMTGGIGDGRHAFTVIFPGGLSPLERHVIQVLGEADGCELPGSPAVIEAASTFDAGLRKAVSAAIAALATRAEHDEVLGFLAEQTECLLQRRANLDSQLEARRIHREFERRWGRGGPGTGEQPQDSAGRPPTPARRALVIDDWMPAPQMDAGSVAILSHMQALQRLGYEVNFIPAESLAPDSTAIAALESAGIRCCHAPYYASVEEVLRRQQDGFEVIYLHRVANASKYLALARQYARRARIVYSVADLHHLRILRQAQIEGRPELLSHSRRLQRAECLAASAADVVLTHSTAEAAWLRQAVKGVNVHVVPWAVQPRAGLNRPEPPWSARRGVAFIGNFAFEPNLDAAHYLVGEIMPLVWGTDSSIQCLLVGSHMPEGIKRLGGPGVVVVGQVPDLDPVFQTVRLSIAPLRYGAGIKGKVISSLAAGVPCVMSPTAAEGLALGESGNAMTGADAQALAALVLMLHSDEERWRKLARMGRDFIASEFSEECVDAGLQAAIDGRRAPGETGTTLGRLMPQT